MSATSQATSRTLTIAEFEALPEDGQKHELLWGELISVSPSYRHGLLQSRVISALTVYVEDHGLGDVVAKTAIEIPTDPPSVLIPDVAFVRAGAAPPADQQVRRYSSTVPDLVVEVISPSETTRSIRTKVTAYLDHGVGIVVLVYPESRQIALWSTGQTPRVLGRNDSLNFDDVVPGFALSLARLFR